MRLREKDETELLELKHALNRAAFVATLDAEGRFLEANEKLILVAGFRPEELIGHSFRKFLADELPPVLWRDLREQLKRHGTWCGELHFRSKNGGSFWAECTVVAYPAPGTSRIRVVAFDITERKAVEHSLSNNQTFLRTLMQSAPVGIFLADADGTCTYVNQSWSQVSGVHLRTAISPGWETAVHPDDAEEVIRAWKAFVRGGETFCREFRYLHTDGSESYVLGTAIRLDAQPGPRSRFLRVEQNLTDLKRSERRLTEQRIKMVAASKMTALGEMAGGIAHEINNPLAIIHGNAELLKVWAKSGQANTERLQDLANTFVSTSGRISKIIKALRAIARDADHDPLEETTVRALLDYVMALSSSRARDGQVSLSVEYFSPELRLLCRPAQVCQILLNLLNNSFSAVEHCPERWITLSVVDEGETLAISVTDSGSGIENANRRKLFQPFFTTRPVGSGMGLGLSVARGLAESLGGQLLFDETSPRTRFTLRLRKRPEVALVEAAG